MTFRSRIDLVPQGRIVSLLAAAFLMILCLACAEASASVYGAHRTVVVRRSPGVPRALAVAAARRTAADRRLVRAAKQMRRCLRRHPRRAAACAASRRAVQHAGRRFSRAEKAMTAAASRNSRRSSLKASSSRRRAPRLSAEGRLLKWRRVGQAKTYLLKSNVPGEAAQYSLVSGTSTAPPPVPGTTVSYRVRTTIPGSAWSPPVAIDFEPVAVPTEAPKAAPKETPDDQAAPALQVSGQTLKWSAVAKVQTYIVLRTAAGVPDQYTVVAGTSMTPAAAPGATVHFSVRTAVDGSAWAPEVSISYPAQETTKARTPEVVETPAAPASAPAGFQPGLDSGQEPLDLSATQTLGAKLVRVEFDIAETPAQLETAVADYANEGVRVLLLATFTSRMPSSAEARGLAAWAKAYGPGGSFWANRSDGQLAVQSIEFGNETDFSGQYHDEPGDASYSERAALYAVRLKEAAEAIAAASSSVGLLAQEDDQSGDWINAMYAAVPNLTQYVAGWTIHPYGGREYNAGRFARLIKQTAEHGASAVPIDITEFGLTTDNGRCLTYNEGWNPCMSYQEAATVLTSEYDWMRELLGSRLAIFILYQVRDQKPTGATTEWQAYFGALQHEDQPKGAYTTAVESILQS